MGFVSLTKYLSINNADIANVQSAYSACGAETTTLQKAHLGTDFNLFFFLLLLYYQGEAAYGLS